MCVCARAYVCACGLCALLSLRNHRLKAAKPSCGSSFTRALENLNRKSWNAAAL